MRKTIALQDEPHSGRKGKISTELLRQIVDQAIKPPATTGASAMDLPRDRRSSS
jgi:hypothetical protein